ncbi:hypothetical protein ACFWBN_03760 [Streptomyces sp. NPDC059989]
MTTVVVNHHSATRTTLSRRVLCPAGAGDERDQGWGFAPAP